MTEEKEPTPPTTPPSDSGLTTQPSKKKRPELPQPSPPLRKAVVVPLVGYSLLLGAIGNVLVYPAYLGIGATLWALLLLGAMAWFHYRESPGTLRSAQGIYALAAVAALCLTWRDAPFLRYGSVALFLFAVIWIQLAASGISFRRLPIAALFLHLAGALQAWAMVLWVQCGMARFGAPKLPRKIIRPIMRGSALAMVLLLFFGTLLARADARFSEFLDTFVSRDWVTWLSRAFWFTVFSAMSIVITSNRARLDRYWTPTLDGLVNWIYKKTKTLVALELLIPMVALDVLFGVFMLTQFSYLFGGEAYVQTEAGATYAQYARRGFFELATVVALVLPMQLFFDDWLPKTSPSGRKLFHRLAGIQSALLLCILASAAHRMALYQSVYGLTQLRLYASAAILWIGLCIVWHMATVLRNQRDRFLFGALVTAITLFIGVQAVNPDALVARVNIARITERSPATPGPGRRPTRPPQGPYQLDVNYLKSLSIDAVPALRNGLIKMNDTDGAVLRRHLSRISNDEAYLWSWSWSRWQASRR